MTKKETKKELKELKEMKELKDHRIDEELLEKVSGGEFVAPGNDAKEFKGGLRRR